MMGAHKNNQKSQGDDQMSVSRRMLLKASAAATVLGGPFMGIEYRSGFATGGSLTGWMLIVAEA
jgi:hypothetical protein